MREVIAPFRRLAVPSIHSDYSTGRAARDERRGRWSDHDRAGGPDPRKEAAEQLLESFYKQIMVDGFFHADPHPGNLMWQPEEDKLYFLDLGMVGEVGAGAPRAR